MKLTIIPSDQAIYIDRVAIHNLDVAYVPANVHALQWDDSVPSGHIEFTDGTPNQDITSLPVWGTQAISVYNTAKAAAEAAAAAAAAKAAQPTGA